MSVELETSDSIGLAVVCAGFGGGRLASVSVGLVLLSVGIEIGAGGSKLAIVGSTVGLGAVAGGSLGGSFVVFAAGSFVAFAAGSFVAFAAGSFGVSAAGSFGVALGDSFEGSMLSKS